MGKTALITGASSGLGLELARLFAQDGHDLVVVARRRDHLEALATRLAAEHGVAARVIAEDLADPVAPRRIFAELKERRIDVEFLVNSAGFGMNGPFAESDLERALALVQVNVAALMQLTGLILPGMIARRSGRILNLGSTAGFQPGPGMAVYYASKAFVNSFTEALAFELRGTGVTATVSCPGATSTEFAQVAGTEQSVLFHMGATSATFVAKHAYRAMMAGKRMSLPGWRAKLGLQLVRIGSRGAVMKTTARLNEIVPRSSARQISDRSSSGN
ncbi:MAG TPA: SDR family oxidoreductase [Polyangia bacterium]|nr:SDR family oxidoreductase [Polyangia bacterium]